MSLKRRILIAGGGAIGGAAAGYIARAGEDVTVVDGWHRNVEAIRRHGLRVEGPDEQFSVSLKALQLDELATSFDVVLIAVKAYDTEWMCRLLEPHLSSSGVVVSLQNGINEDVIASLVGARRTLGCVVHMNGGLFQPGVVTRYSGRGWTAYTLGALEDGDPGRLAEVTELLSSVGTTKTTHNIRGALWGKLALNAMNNGLAALAGLTTSRLWVDDDALRIMVGIGAETAAVAAAAGIDMEAIKPTGAPRPLSAEVLRAAGTGDAGPYEEARAVFAMTAAARSGRRESVSSLLQDVQKGRRTEISHLNGYISRLGAGNGIPTPLNNAIVEMVKSLEMGDFEPGDPDWRSLLTRVGGQDSMQGDQRPC